MAVLLRELHPLVDALRDKGYTVVGPTVRDGAIVLAELDSAHALPYGWGVETAPGRYRLRERGDRAAFGHAAGPQSWKRYLRPPRDPLWTADRDGDAFVVSAPADETPHEDAGSTHVREARAAVDAAAARMGRTLPEADLHELLAGAYAAPRWDEVAGRCLSCGNCTMVCPTCFCTTVEDVTDLTGTHAERWLRWDSCFDLDFSYLHGGPVRTSTASRYRQWLTHKLGTWHDQFGESGCVGCGRCIAWCPVGIDITEETAALAEASSDG